MCEKTNVVTCGIWRVSSVGIYGLYSKFLKTKKYNFLAPYQQARQTPWHYPLVGIGEVSSEVFNDVCI